MPFCQEYPPYSPIKRKFEDKSCLAGYIKSDIVLEILSKWESEQQGEIKDCGDSKEEMARAYWFRRGQLDGIRECAKHLRMLVSIFS